MMGEIERKELKVVLDYPSDLKQPQYCNFANIQFTKYEYTFDFAYVDPKQLKGDLSDNIIKASVIQRVCMNHEVAKLFLNALQNNIKKYNKAMKEKK